jgi:hypothetical protein
LTCSRIQKFSVFYTNQHNLLPVGQAVLTRRFVLPLALHRSPCKTIVLYNIKTV